MAGDKKRLNGMQPRAAVALTLLMLVVALAPQPGVAKKKTKKGAGNVPPEVIELVPEGYGAAARGGEGGRVIYVLNRRDDGLGSLRWAIAEAKPPTTIRFKIGGVIRLEKPVRIDKKQLTIDGLSAARKGGVTIEGGLQLMGCEDVVIRHVHLRGGYDPISIMDCRTVLVDHVSAIWGADENLDVWGSRDVTIQWSIMAEGLAEGGHEKGAHSMGSLQGGGSRDVTTHHCLFSGNVDRNPLLSGPNPDDYDAQVDYRFDVVNNVIYNYWNGAKARAGVQVNFIGNTFRAGPDTSDRRAEIRITDRAPLSRVHCDDNTGPNRSGAEQAECALVAVPSQSETEAYCWWTADDAELASFVSEQPFATRESARVAAEPAARAYDSVLAGAGAWPRDAEDKRLIEEVRQRRGKVGRVGPRWRELYALRPAAVADGADDSDDDENEASEGEALAPAEPDQDERGGEGDESFQ